MELKEFKSGVEALARFTNQREREPRPFMLQIAKSDGQLSLIAGDRAGTVVWRLDSWYKGDIDVHREGIPSKMLVQAAKSLKGKGVSVHFKVHKDALEVFTSPGGGSIKLGYVDLPPNLMRPPTGDPFYQINIPNLDEFVKKVNVCSVNPYLDLRYDQMWFQPDRAGLNVNVMSEYRAYQTRLLADSTIRESLCVRSTFWNALRGSTTNAAVRFFETGIRVLVSGFEFSTDFLEGRTVPLTWLDKYFPEGSAPDVALVTPRKPMIELLKGMGGTTDMGISAEGQAHLSHKTNHAMLNVVKKLSWGHISYNPEYMIDILNVLTDENVLIAWNNPANLMLVRDEKPKTREGFCLAPVVYR